MELIVTVFAVFAVTALAGLGIAALPWTEGEVEASAAAFAALPGAVGAVAGGVANEGAHSAFEATA